jgi:raffinose/stachyose/melibiose transport system permease protein
VTDQQVSVGRGPGVLSRAAGRRAARQKDAKLKRGELWTALVFIAPALALYIIFMMVPFFNSIYLSFTNWNGATVLKEWVGLDNYTVMPGDDELIASLGHNVIWIVVGTIAPVVIGLVLALVLWTTPRFTLVFRTLFFLPFVLPVVVVGLVWQWIYHPLWGPLNKVLDAIGLESISRGWLGRPATALYAVLGAAIWGATGFTTMVLYAGLQGVNTDLVDAAAVDGANWWQRARYVVIPSIAPVLTLVTAVTLIEGFAVIDFILVMTGGGPGTSTSTLGFYAYKQGFQLNRIGYGSAVSMLMTVLTLIAAVIFVRIRERGRDGV